MGEEPEQRYKPGGWHLAAGMTQDGPPGVSREGPRDLHITRALIKMQSQSLLPFPSLHRSFASFFFANPFLTRSNHIPLSIHPFLYISNLHIHFHHAHLPDTSTLLTIPRKCTLAIHTPPIHHAQPLHYKPAITHSHQCVSSEVATRQHCPRLAARNGNTTLRQGINKC
ncbi:hypothetical protein E2C01_064149 [Portunus trituberculatus]|uniref:Uncharacterized protein n=1 Tax=Portunus trituberculatus TaxID=210409 RepID=A0A5B7HIZ1_PORTR|nr:hypothetical protein [Portunus trituberculatus]